MANIVKSLTEANIKKFGIERCPEHDFTDDGNRFRGFAYKGIIMTQCRTQGETYLAVRVDYGTYDFSFDEWFDSEEYKLADEFNGVSEVNVDKLIENIEKIITRIEILDKHAKQNADNVDMTDVKEQAEWEVANAEAILERAKSLRFWEVNSKYDLETICNYIRIVESSIEYAKTLDYSKLSYKEKMQMKKYVGKEYGVIKGIGISENSYVGQLEKYIDKYTK